MASHWAEYATHKEYTNLQYHTALDDKVRESHAALEGITLPYEDPFWNTAFPPQWMELPLSRGPSTEGGLPRERQSNGSAELRNAHRRKRNLPL